MGVFSNNRTMLNEVEIPVAEGYNTSVAAEIMLVEAVKEDMSLFEAMIADDFNEIMATQEGAMLEAEIIALSENALQNAWARVKEIITKIIAKLKAMIAAFIAKFNSVVIADNKKFAESIRKQLFSGKDYSGMTYKWRTRKEDYTTFSKEVLEDMVEMESECNAESDEEELKKVINANFKDLFDFDLADVDKEFFKDFFEEEKELKASDAAIKEAYDFLVANPKFVKDIKDAAKKTEDKFKTSLRNAEKNEKEAKAHKDEEGGNILYLRASALAKVYNLTFSGITATHRCCVKAAKLEIKQSRQLLAKAVAYKPEAKEESAMLMSEAVVCEGYAVDSMFDAE